MPKEFVRPVPVIGSDSALISINLMMIGEWLDRGYVGKKEKAALSIRILGRRYGELENWAVGVQKIPLLARRR